MEKPNLDDVVRNLLVYLKGQVPSLQNKHSSDDLSRQIQGIVTVIRNSILQIEGAVYYNPKDTKDFKDVQKELDTLRRANQKFEESLFLEMEKNQKVFADVEKSKADLELKRKEFERFRSEVEVQKTDLATQVQKLGKLTEENGKQKEEIVRLKSELRIREDTLKTTQEKLAQANRAFLTLQNEVAKRPAPTIVTEPDPSEKFAQERALRKVEEERQALTKTLEALQKEHALLRSERDLLSPQLVQAQEKIREFETQILTKEEKLQSSLRELEQIKLTLLQVNREHEEKFRDIPSLLLSKDKQVAELTALVKDLEKKLNAYSNTEIVKNLKAVQEAKVSYLEKSLAEVEKKLIEKEEIIGKTPEKIEILLREKTQLEQRLVDMEAVVRRFSSSRFKTGKESEEGVFSFGPEECVFFFEFFSFINAKLQKNLEFSDIRFKAEEAMQILLKTHAIDPIPAFGHLYSETQHKPVKAFYSNLFDDGMIVFEVNRGYRFKEHVIQRSLVWIQIPF